MAIQDSLVYHNLSFHQHKYQKRKSIKPNDKEALFSLSVTKVCSFSPISRAWRNDYKLQNTMFSEILIFPRLPTESPLFPQWPVQLASFSACHILKSCTISFPKDLNLVPLLVENLVTTNSLLMFYHIAY